MVESRLVRDRTCMLVGIFGSAANSSVVSPPPLQPPPPLSYLPFSCPASLSPPLPSPASSSPPCCSPSGRDFGEKLDSQLVGKLLLFQGLVTFYFILILSQSKIFEQNVSSQVLYLEDIFFRIFTVFF